MNESEIFKECVNHYEEVSQILMAIEELSELIVELCHSLRAVKPFNLKRITEEIADAKLMLDQLQYIFHVSDVDLSRIRESKISRLKGLLAEVNKESNEIGSKEDKAVSGMALHSDSDVKALLTVRLKNMKRKFIRVTLPYKYIPCDGYIDFNSLPEGYNAFVNMDLDGCEGCFIDTIRGGDGFKVEVLSEEDD